MITAIDTGTSIEKSIHMGMEGATGWGHVILTQLSNNKNKIFLLTYQTTYKNN